MDLDTTSQRVVDAINASGVVPFRRFDPIQARTEILKLRVERPDVPTHPMASAWEESFATPDGPVKVRTRRIGRGGREVAEGSGFRPTAVYRSFDRGPCEDSPEIVMVATRPSSPRLETGERHGACGPYPTCR